MLRSTIRMTSSSALRSVTGGAQQIEGGVEVGTRRRVGQEDEVHGDVAHEKPALGHVVVLVRAGLTRLVRDAEVVAGRLGPAQLLDRDARVLGATLDLGRGGQPLDRGPYTLSRRFARPGANRSG